MGELRRVNHGWGPPTSPDRQVFRACAVCMPLAWWGAYMAFCQETPAIQTSVTQRHGVVHIRKTARRWARGGQISACALSMGPAGVSGGNAPLGSGVSRHRVGAPVALWGAGPCSMQKSVETSLIAHFEDLARIH
jgi:hypothetical protein